MAIAGNNIIAWCGWGGLAKVATAAADYPDEGDVRDGTTYASGTMTGTLGVGLGETGASYLTDWVNAWAEIVAESSTFQTWTGAADAAEAAAFVYEWAIDYDDLDVDTDYPFCLVTLGGDQKVRTLAASGANIATAPAGSVELVFEGIVPDGYTHKQANDWMTEKCLAIRSELESIAVSEAFRQIVRGITLLHGPARADAEERENHADIMQMAFAVHLGLGGAP